MPDLRDRLIKALPVTRLGLAVSGGGDSMALLHLAAPLLPAVATVNHGLRPEAAAEAALVAETCARLGLKHQTLHWKWDGRGNLQDAARRGRRDLLADWARPLGLSVALGHTQDDLAETFLMRLGRGAGVDGLSAMTPAFDHGSVAFLRPLLSFTRAELRLWLAAQGAGWVDDPSNTDPRFDRARMRAAIAGLGLDSAAIAGSARHLAQARAALEILADHWQPLAFEADRGTLMIRPALWQAPAETRRRLLRRAILWLAPAPYAPRGEKLDRLEQALREDSDATLAGVRFHRGRGWREARALPPAVPADQIWDGCWTAKAPPGAVLGALGDGLAQCPGSDLPRAVQRALPAIWIDGQPVCAPFAGLDRAEITIHRLQDGFPALTGALSH